MSKKRWHGSTSFGVASSCILIGLSFACLGGCGDTKPGEVSKQEVSAPETEESATIVFANTEKPLSEGDAVSALLQAADALWTARVNDDFVAMHGFQRPDARSQATPEEYAKWAVENIPFKWNSYELGGAHVHGVIGWVQVTQNVGMRKMASVPPRDTTVWEHWMFLENEWLPVASTTADNLPQVPAIRDLDAEEELADRFALSWQYRHDRNWEKLYEMTSNESRDATTAAQFAEAQDLLILVQCRVEWVEVIGDVGRVASFMQFKYNDPSMQKMEPKTTIVIERWIREDGKWMLHNPRPSDPERGAAQ